MMFGWCSRESREDSLSKSATATSTFSFSGRSVLTAHGAPSSEQAEATQNSPAPRRFIGPRDAQSTSFEPTGALTSAIVVRQEASDRENEPRVAACSFVAAFCSIGVASGIAEGKPSVTGGRCPDRGEPALSARPEYVNADSLARRHAIESVAAKARSSQKLVGRERSRPAGEDLAEYRPILSASNSSQEEEEDFEGANGGGASDIEHRPGHPLGSNTKIQSNTKQSNFGDPRAYTPLRDGPEKRIFRYRTKKNSGAANTGTPREPPKRLLRGRRGTY